MIESISAPASQLQDSYTVVVVGSGYGGGVAASRLARAGQQVCVLERGREILPGEYPDEMFEAREEMQIDTPNRHVGSQTGMFDLRLNDDMNVLVGCGLGGTSLINANVALEMDDRQFVEDDWPQAYRDDPRLLDQFYERARTMLDSSPYPDDAPELNKLSALAQSARHIGREDRFYRPPLNVNFKTQLNRFGVVQRACNNCGDCTSGCNESAKNTTLMNYLPDAHNHQAQIFTQASVERIEKTANGWRVHVSCLDVDDMPVRTIEAEVVVLAAGALGSTEILLRSAANGLSLSSKLGHSFSGNGDVLGFGYNCYWRDRKTNQSPRSSAIDDNVDFERLFDAVQDMFSEDDPESESRPPKLMPDEVYLPMQLNSIGVGSMDVEPENYPGPCITGIIDLRDDEQPQKRLVVEEGVIPGALANFLPPAFLFGSMLDGDYFKYGPTEGKGRLQDAEAIGKILEESPSELADACFSGATGRTQTYLVMSKDDASGKLVLGERDRVRVEWPGVGQDPLYHRDNAILDAVTEGVHGQYIANPMWSDVVGRQLITVHPIGGCAMADSASAGVVNGDCQVFDGHSGEVHEGLYVCDGAVLPSSVGVNPLLTISAVAERAVELLAEQRGWKIDWHLEEQRPLDAHESIELRVNTLKKKRIAIEDGIVEGASSAAAYAMEAQFPHSLTFSEQMRGYYSEDVTGLGRPGNEELSTNYEIASRLGRLAGNTMVASFTVLIGDLDKFAASTDHSGILSGSLYCPALCDEEMQLTDGHFELLRVDKNKIENWQMNYWATVERPGGTPLRFVGQKILDEKADSHWWRDVTTLFVQIQEGGQPVGFGILELTLDDLIAQATTLDVQPTTVTGKFFTDQAEGVGEYLKLMKALLFGKHFGMTLFNAYGGLLATLKNHASQENKIAKTQRRPLNAPAPEVFSSQDVGGKFQLTRYQGGKRGPVILAPGFGVTAASFATPTVDVNLVEYLTQADYDVWLFDYRASPHSGFAETEFCIDDIAEHDWMEAVNFVRSATGSDSVQVVAHCVGSMSLLMALLRGLQGVRSAICSQLTLHPVTDWFNYLKADIEVVKLLQLGDRDVIDIRSDESNESRAMDALLYNLPVAPGEECNNPVCRRIFAIFGPSYTHNQLNSETHAAMEEMFGRVAVSSFSQLATILRRGQVVDAKGGNTYLPNVEKLQLPLTFIAGENNGIFFPETSARTYQWLCAHNDPNLYERKIFADYAHMDMFIGKNAAEAGGPFEYIKAQLERFN